MKSKRKVVITNMIKNELYGGPDIDGERSITCDIDFILEEPCIFNVFGEKFVIDRVKMGISWGDTLYLAFANANRKFKDFEVSKKFVHPIYLKVKEEEANGILKNWCFEDWCFSNELYDRLTEKGSQNHPIW